MQTFKLNEQFMIVCQSFNTRTGFKHVATLLSDGLEIDDTKCCYTNRTWERFTYESVLVKLIDKHFMGAEHERFLNKIER